MRRIAIYLACFAHFFGLISFTFGQAKNADLLKAPGQDDGASDTLNINTHLLQKVRPLYPDILLARPRANEPQKFFSVVKEVARVHASDGQERLAVLVGWKVPAAYTDHGAGELLIYSEAKDEVPAVRMSTFSLATPIRLVAERWIRFGNDEILLSLYDSRALAQFEQQGEGALILGLSRDAARAALDVYLNHGRAEFVQVAPMRREPWRFEGLPDKISRFELYPSLVEDSRYSFFKYFDSWEATVLVRLTPADEPEKRVILELGARGLTAGIEATDVELLLWEMSESEPTDRPAPEVLIPGEANPDL